MAAHLRQETCGRQIGFTGAMVTRRVVMRDDQPPGTEAECAREYPPRFQPDFAAVADLQQFIAQEPALIIQENSNQPFVRPGQRRAQEFHQRTVCRTDRRPGQRLYHGAGSQFAGGLNDLAGVAQIRFDDRVRVDRQRPVQPTERFNEAFRKVMRTVRNQWGKELLHELYLPNLRWRRWCIHIPAASSPITKYDGAIFMVA